ncbi:MAG TPA: phosphoribosylamine--glycine ligase [Abditibacteriaceae bacterium]|nr:phosphoribosylamine--glycine ligase [Abditibacteriaceae bacterium]
MKVLVIGGGGREHALCWKLAQSTAISKLYCAPGNPGIEKIAECPGGEPFDVARRIQPDLVVVGPEAPLAAGLVDRLQEAGIPAFGPTQRAAQLEASKSFCKQLLKKYAIPTGDFEVFEDTEAAKAYIRDKDDDAPTVVKYDGLAAGKGVVIAPTRRAAEQAVDELWQLGRSQNNEESSAPALVVEECLVGEEISLLALTDGNSILPLAPAQDYKRIGEGDAGPNTGGMGCYSPVPAFDPVLYQRAVEEILEPTLRALQAEGITYRGVLYAGLMLTETGPKVIEYNCRFGDPETQVILPRLKSDLLPLLLACTGQGAPLRDLECEWTEQAAVCVVLSSSGYPASDYRKGDVITGLEEAENCGTLVFHAGTARRNGEIITSGGRVLGVTALGDDFLEARQRCYEGVARIHFEGAHYRRDIGWRCL